MGLEDICRILLVAACVFSVIYSIWQLCKYKMPLFFKCAFFSSVSQLLCTFLYLVISIDTTWNHYFSLADFGSVTAALFLVVAIRKYIPKEYEESHGKLNVLGILVALIIVTSYLAAPLFMPNAETVFGCIVCGLPQAVCAYYCVDTIQNKYGNPFVAGVKKYCVLFFITLIITAFGAFAYSFGHETLYSTYLLSSAFISPVIIASEMYFLKKGLEPWSI